MSAPSTAAAASRRARILHGLTLAGGALVFAVAMVGLRHALGEYRYDDVRLALGRISVSAVCLSFLFTCLGYLALTGYDTLALRYIGHSIPYSQSAMASLVSYAIANNAGFANLASSSIRYRLYSGWGLSAIEVAKLIAFCTTTFWLGYLAVAGVALTVDPFPWPRVIEMRAPTRAVGIAFLIALLAYGGFAAMRKKPLRLRSIEIQPPGGRLFAAQVIVSAIDWVMSGMALWVLLPVSLEISSIQFLGIFLLAGIIALLSHVPGGVGVLETVLVTLLAPHGAAASEVLGSVLVYRAIYYLLPLLLASVLFAAHELLRHRTVISSISRTAAAGLIAVAPPLLAMTSFLGGVILLVSTATPPSADRLRVLHQAIPLAVIEVSHFLAAVTGGALVVVSRGLLRRLDGAMRLAAVLLGAGVLLSLLKGIHWEESVALAIMLGVLLASRREFYRKSSLLNEPVTAGWALAAGVAVGGSLWLGLFAYEHVEYSGELWWRFAVDQHAPRFLRASVGAVTVLVLFAVYRLVRPLEVEPSRPTAEEAQSVRDVVSTSLRASANLALLPDKSFLFNDAKSAFVMYGVEGRTWIAMGDPIGPEQEWSELVWQFQRTCDRYAARTVFYEVSARRLDLYADLGLVLLKLGEEARVDLESFSLEGHGRKELRHTLKHCEKAGCSFRIAEPGEVVTMLPRLREISDEWLASKNAREKRFSLGCFEESYVSSFPCALIESHGEVVAFANLWLSAEHKEASIDLMRYASKAPNGSMDYLFVELMLWAKAQGYRTFSFGMAPLAGLERSAAASLWHRIGTFVYKHGEHFYNFEGLRRYKDKFDPSWEPVYLACPSVWSLPQILADLSTLVSGGVQGTFRK